MVGGDEKPFNGCDEECRGNGYDFIIIVIFVESVPSVVRSWGEQRWERGEGSGRVVEGGQFRQ